MSGGIAFFSKSPSLFLTVLSIAVKLLCLDPHIQRSHGPGASSLLRVHVCEMKSSSLYSFTTVVIHALALGVLQHGFSHSNLAVLLCNMQSGLLSLVFQAFYVTTQSILPGSVKSQILLSSWPAHWSGIPCLFLPRMLCVSHSLSLDTTVLHLLCSTFLRVQYKAMSLLDYSKPQWALTPLNSCFFLNAIIY